MAHSFFMAVQKLEWIFRLPHLKDTSLNEEIINNAEKNAAVSGTKIYIWMILSKQLKTLILFIPMFGQAWDRNPKL